ncbi:hypothetical protein BOO86_20400 [Mycobacterium sp. CBMA 234]|nr:hypothetical protein [Mycolicibacterium sp. CBMA 234]
MRTRAAILDAAEVLLSHRSADAIKVDDVAEVSGISPASVYGHFGTKDALVDAVVERLLDTSMATLAAAYARDGSPFEQVQEAGRAYMQLLVEHPALTRYLSVNALAGPGLPADGLVAERMHLLRSMFEERIQAAIDAGELQPIDSRLMSFFLFGAWNGVAALALRQDQAQLTPAEVEQSLLQALQVLRQGVVVQKEGSGG